MSQQAFFMVYLSRRAPGSQTPSGRRGEPSAARRGLVASRSMTSEERPSRASQRLSARLRRLPPLQDTACATLGPSWTAIPRAPTSWLSPPSPSWKGAESELNCKTACKMVGPLLLSYGGHARNRTGVYGFAVRCVTTPPRGHHCAFP